jgi:hypothetical protein
MPRKKPAVSGKLKGAHTAKAKKARGDRRGHLGGASKTQKLVCRYCSGDDLAPSFKKRRDARCRTCFKKRYGPAQRKKTVTRSRKVKAAK